MSLIAFDLESCRNRDQPARQATPAATAAGTAWPAPPGASAPAALTPSANAGAEAADAVAAQAVAAKAAYENFPVALRLLPRRYREHLMADYVFARTADDIGDQAPAAERLRLLAELKADVGRLYATIGEPGPAPAGGAEGPTLPAVRGLARTVTECAIPSQPFVDLIRANQQDQVVTRYRTFDDLADYCRLSANPVGRIVLHVFGCFSAARAEQSDLICTGLQLAEHWQDVAEDLRAGRIYLPLEDLAVHGELMAFEVGRARSLIDAGAPLVGTLRGAARAAVAGYVAGGRAALAAIAAADHDVLAATPRPGRLRTAAELVTAFTRGR